MGSDVVVVGAGIAGASVAFEMAKAGYDVTVVDKAPGPGQGSTGASSAVVRFNLSSWVGVACAWDSRFAWVEWADHVEAPADETVTRHRETGLAMLDVDAAPRGLYLPHFDRAGIAYQEWDSAAWRDRIPGFYVAFGTSGNQFRNAPIIGQILTAIIDAVENGHGHDHDPVQFTTSHTHESVDLGAFSRRRERNASNSGTVLD